MTRDVKLLLDTHVFLWWWQGDRALSAIGRNAIANADVVFVSVVSAWEMAIKIALGRLRFPGTFAAAVDGCRFSRLPLEFSHVEALRALPRHHADPFDRMLVVQAMTDGLTLATHDRELKKYGVETLQV